MVQFFILKWLVDFGGSVVRVVSGKGRVCPLVRTENIITVRSKIFVEIVGTNGLY